LFASHRLRSFRRLLIHAHSKLGLKFGFVLWDGSTVPEGLAPDALAIRIADEGVVAAVLRRPTIDTVANLWSAARLDIQGGTLFDIAASRPSVRSRTLIRALDKHLVLGTLARFLIVSRGQPFPLENIHDDRALTVGSEGANRDNVGYHYDVSNLFYSLFLDPAMVYSCAYFTDWNNDLAKAQSDKLEMICRKLRLRPGEKFLDIGCGWGALICHAAKYHGVHAHGITLSREQFSYAVDRIEREGLKDRVTLELRDYVHADGTFDKIASIGMFEHVGIANHVTYFQTINRLLRPGGLYLHHAIHRPAKRDRKRFRSRSREYTALIRYIFPGGELDHLGMSVDNLQRHGFEVHDVEGWREHYARTCRSWHDRLLARQAEAAKEAGTVRARLWIAYLAGCSMAFERNTVGIYQTLASKRVRGASGLPPTRADLYGHSSAKQEV
jgi:cyclopropane-fatty-acyl-phospholipid synthase